MFGMKIFQRPVTHKLLVQFYATPPRAIALWPCESVSQHFLTQPFFSAEKTCFRLHKHQKRLEQSSLFLCL